MAATKEAAPIGETDKAQLITSYLQETGTWCETTDSDRHFTVRSVHELLRSPVFSAAALALYIIRRLISHNPADNSLAALSCYVLLYVYEMMGSPVEEWRRHLRGCSIFLKNAPWTGNRVGIGKTCFWAFARIDLWAAFLTGQKTLIPTDSWVVDEDPRSVADNGDVDDFGNLAILIFAKIINLCATARNSYTHETVAELWTQLQLWWRERPEEIRPLFRTQPSNPEPMPTIIYSKSSARFAVERMAMLQQLRKIECETGWRTSDRVKELRQMWDLE
ncbi:hypothetical protein LQW54_004953 [Pestalotiopsis sp. IQ-011]